jgi:hypothetical protein
VKRSPLRKVSPKRAGENRQYALLRKVFLIEKPYCEVFETCCTRKSTDVHHVNHREGKRLLDRRDWLSCCRACHEFLHQHPTYARKAGFLK